jgi:hypothetical protein
MDLSSLLVQVISGAVGGNAVGAVSKDTSLGSLGNTIAGAIGGGVGGQILSALLGAGSATAGLDLGTIVQGFLTGGVSGGPTVLVLGFLKAKLAA